MSKETWVDGDVITQARVQTIVKDLLNEAADDLTKLAVLGTSGAGVKTLEFRVAEVLAADKILDLVVGGTDRTLNMGGNIVVAGNFTTQGAFNLKFILGASVDLTLPAANDTLVGRDTSDTLTNKTLTSPDINGGTVDSLTSLSIRSTGAAQDLKIATSAAYTATRTLTVNIPTGAGVGLTLVGDLVTAGGAFNLTFTLTAATNVTLPTSGTLVADTVTALASLATVGTITVGIWNATVITVPYGGTGLATITDHGVLVGSGAGAVTPLAVGATGTILTGVTGADPTWTTATYPATTTINRILFSSANNVVDQIATGNSGILVTGGTGIPSIATDIPTAVTIGTAYIHRVGGTDVAVADGGTGLSSYTVGDILQATAATTIGGLADVAVGSILVSGGVGVVAAWATDIPTAVTIGAAYIYRAAGTDVAVADGGTNMSAWVIGDIVHATAATTLAGLADVAVGSILVSGGVGVVPAWATDIPTAVTIGAAYIYRAAGTDVPVTDGGTGLSAFAVGDILHATAAGTLAGLADVAVGQVLCSGGVGVVAAWSATPTFTSSVQTGRGEVGILNLKDEAGITLDANGEVTITQTQHSIDTWGGGASDDLQGIIGGQRGDILIIRPVNGARTVVAKHGGALTAGVALNLASGIDFTMDEDDDFLMLFHDGALWQEISRSENHA